jgi:Allene oxide cyclase barrel like domain
MKRLLVPAAAAAAAVLVFAVVNAMAGSSGAKVGGSVHVIEHATSDAVTNGSGDSAGNILTFANDVYDAADAHKVGTDQGYCVRIVVGATWECNWTTSLSGGQITVEGPFSDTGNTVLAITGGTGAYRNARGSMQLKFHNPAGTEFDFVFDLIG